MCHVDELDTERTYCYRLAGTDQVQIGGAEKFVFFEAAFHQGECEVGAVDGDIELAEEKRNGADVIFMSVGQDEGTDVFAMLLQVGEIRRNNVHSKEFRVGEHHSRVDYDDVVTVADRHRVHPELAESAERDDLQLTIGHKFHRTLLRRCSALLRVGMSANRQDLSLLTGL